MNNYFVIGDKKYVRTREFVQLTKGKVHERVDIYDVKTNSKKGSILYTQREIQQLLDLATTSKK